VVEDDELIRHATAAVLQADNFVVAEAADALQAMSILGSRDDIAVVFTDVDLPGRVNGEALAQMLVRQAPWISVVVTSGAHPPGRIGFGFLAKPYRADVMLRLIRRAAEQAQRSQDF